MQSFAERNIMTSVNIKSTKEIKKLTDICLANSTLDEKLYLEFDVKQGLRDKTGKGVLTGLTNISEINSFREIDGKRVPIEGELFYRGINVKDLTQGFMSEDRFGYEETAYLLLMGSLPSKEELGEFGKMLASKRSLPRNFVRDVIMKAPSGDLMNSLERSVLTLASYDKMADDVSLPNVMNQCLDMIAEFPLMAVYAYQAYNHYIKEKSLYIHRPSTKLSTAENILRLLRADKKYTDLEAKVLDLALVLHMEHGGGNNSTFTTRVVTSSGTDTYSAMAAALASLKGPKHGGANIKVTEMMEDIKKHVKDYRDDEEVKRYLGKIVDKEAFDKKGLIYGMGHAIYSVSDPRAIIFKEFVRLLAKEKGMEKEFELYEKTEELGKKIIEDKRHIYKGVCINVDFYSGFVYRMLGLPVELFTPMFAVARIVGWSAHRMEELINMDKIIRPAYDSVCPRANYVPLEERTL